MDWLNAIRIGLKGLAVHKIRAFLSMLGVIFGVASVVAVITVSEGARREVMKQLTALGANNIIVEGIDGRVEDFRERKKRTRLFSEGLTLKEARIAVELEPNIEEFAALRFLSVNVRQGDKTWEVKPVGVTASFLDVMGYQLREGRWIHPADEVDRRRVCVLEEAVADLYFRNKSPLGKKVTIDQEPYTVIGVLQKKETSEKKYTVVNIKELNIRVYVPLATALVRTPQNPLTDEINKVVYRCAATEKISKTALFLEGFYAKAHHCEGRTEEDKDYSIRIARDLLQQITKEQGIFNIVMLASAGISLIVGGIGIMNIMLANVSERRREIGIRRAVGATQSDILRQFLFESMAICLIGGIIGCGIGVGFQHLISELTGWDTIWVWWAALAAVGVSLIDGMIFGTFPAWQAARLDPIDALRFE